MTIQPDPSSSLEKPMRWYNFAIYFSLWFSAIANFITAIRYMTGTIYNNTDVAARMYDLFPMLKTVHICFGVAAAAFVVLIIITRRALERFEKRGPTLLLLLCGLTALFHVICPLLTAAVTDASFLEIIDMTALVSNAAKFIVNKIYYRKRAHMFIY